MLVANLLKKNPKERLKATDVLRKGFVKR